MKNRLHDSLPESADFRLFSRGKSGLLSSLTILLIGAMLTGTACGEGGALDTTDIPSGETTVDSETTPALTGHDAVSDDLPQKNYGGKDFNLLVRTAQAYEFAADEENGDLLNDPVSRLRGAVRELARHGVQRLLKALVV